MASGTTRTLLSVWTGNLHHARVRVLREASERDLRTTALIPSPHPGWFDAARIVHEELAARVAPLHGASVPAWQGRVELWLGAQLQDVEVRIRMRPSGFEGFVRDGRYTTQFERPDVSGGAKHRAVRTLVEHTVLGVPPDCAPADRPVYGYLSGSNESSPALQQYGPVVLHLERSVAARSTFTGADSLDFVVHSALTEPSMVPAPLRRPHITALPAHDFFVATHAPPRFATLDVDPVSRHGFGDLTSYGYAEAQIHGGLRLRDVHAVTITYNAKIDPQISKRLDESGVGWIMTPGDQP